MSKELEALEVLQNYITINEPLETQYPYFKRLSAIRLALTPPTVNEIIEALKKDTEIDTWYYDEELKVFWSGEDIECEEVGEKYHTAYMTNDTRHMITKFYKGDRK